MLNHIQTLQKANARASIYAAKNQYNSLARKAITLKAYYATQAAGSLNRYESTIVGSHVAAIATTSYLKGRIDDFMALLDSVKGTNNICLLQAKSADTAAARREDTLGGKACKLDAPNTTPAQYTAKLVKGDGYESLLHGANSGNNIAPAAATGHCNILLYHNTNGWAQTSPDGASTAMADYLKLATTAGISSFSGKTDLTHTGDDKTKPWKDAHEQITNLKRASNTGLINQTGKPSERGELKCLLAINLDDGSIAEPTKISAEIKKIFEDDTPEKIRETEDAISHEKIPAKTAGLHADKMLGEIEDIEQLEKLQYYYDVELLKNMQSLKKQLEEAQKPKQQQPTEDKEKVCNAAGNDKDKCKELKEKDCVFNKDGKDGEKCTLSKEAKKEAEKENQETEGRDGKPDCSKLLTQQACEDANKNGKKHCGWKKGGDSESDKEEACSALSVLL
uniref:Variant surface glycoprotein 1125.4278 n=1 Tax=Trypanosoma brucei TaxID=5691 RepID=A0A1J0RAI8_9TRYP|nr:variant surface glycoprotein 1125.4278 [Trypanosoma brucei]